MHENRLAGRVVGFYSRVTISAQPPCAALRVVSCP